MKQGCNPLRLPAAGPLWRQPGTGSRLGSGLHHPSGKGPVLLGAAMPAKSVLSHRNVKTWGNQPSKGSLQRVGEGGCDPGVQRCTGGAGRGGGLSCGSILGDRNAVCCASRCKAASPCWSWGPEGALPGTGGSAYLRAALRCRGLFQEQGSWR